MEDHGPAADGSPVDTVRHQAALRQLEQQVARVGDDEVDVASRAMLQRLRAVATVLLPDGSDPIESQKTAELTTGELLTALVGVVQRSLRHDQAWLVYVAMSTVFPMEDVVLAFVRKAELLSTRETVIWLLERSLRAARSMGALDHELDLVVGGVVVDVDFAAKYEHNSGIQRVVRRVLPIWAANQELTMTVWGEGRMSWRTLRPAERSRVLEWDSHREALPDDALGPTRLVVPWRSTVVLVEVPNKVEHCLPLAALARFSGNVVNAVGYDVIPITSAETVPVDMSDHFAKYLAVLKHSGAVAAISGTAADEFSGFASMLAAQGLTGPTVTACVLPADEVHSVGSVRFDPTPLVVCVGSKEPRKNHVAVLAAAERLWLEGVRFELFFIGIVGWDARYFKAWERRLVRAGYPVRAPARVADGELWEAYAHARFTVFPSLHEGYGLPVAESLAYATPVITTDYGSTAEIAADGGCLLVDPRDDEAIYAAMRAMLTDDALVARLRGEAAARPRRAWSEYASQLWTALVPA